MTDTTQTQLTPYQQGVLTELGISTWGLQEKQSSPANVEAKLDLKNTTDAKTVSSELKKDQALAAIQRIKQSTQQTKRSEQVLLSVSSELANSQLLTDILLAFNLLEKGYKPLPEAQHQEYQDFPLSWVEGHTLSLEGNKLTTPDYSRLSQAQHKKQLFKLIQQTQVV
ncbi:DNA polymerase III subunit psi [Paraglaciecola aestuariivivens]